MLFYYLARYPERAIPIAIMPYICVVIYRHMYSPLNPRLHFSHVQLKAAQFNIIAS